MNKRDFEKNPYSPDEDRVAKFLNDKGGIGGGDDPIGFLIISYDYINEERKKLKAFINQLVGIHEGLARALADYNEILSDYKEQFPSTH